MNVHMKNTKLKYKLNFKTMKKGLLTLLAASLVFVGCQNYDDQVDDLNAQISSLKITLPSPLVLVSVPRDRVFFIAVCIDG